MKKALLHYCLPMRRYFLLCSIVVQAFVVRAQHYSTDSPFAHTYSIVARDPNTGEMAVGVQSHWFSVGTVVSWGEAGVGVVATQSFVNKSFGPMGLGLLKEGKSAQEALDVLIQMDDGKDFRQVALLDAQGRVATYTGKKCIVHAGHQQGQGFSVQANMMLNASVWPAMAKAYEANAALPLAERVLAAMEAAQQAGGDVRGKQSAALLVVGAQPTAKPWEEPQIDLRVDDHKAPLQELKRLLKVYRAYEHMNNGDLALEQGNMPQALEEYGEAQQMFPENLEMKYWTAVTLANNGQIRKAIPLFIAIFAKDKHWKILTERLPAAGLLNVSEKELQEILAL